MTRTILLSIDDLKIDKNKDIDVISPSDIKNKKKQIFALFTYKICNEVGYTDKVEEFFVPLNGTAFSKNSYDRSEPFEKNHKIIVDFIYLKNLEQKLLSTDNEEIAKAIIQNYESTDDSWEFDLLSRIKIGTCSSYYTSLLITYLKSEPKVNTLYYEKLQELLKIDYVKIYQFYQTYLLPYLSQNFKTQTSKTNDELISQASILIHPETFKFSPTLELKDVEGKLTMEINSSLLQDSAKVSEKFVYTFQKTDSKTPKPIFILGEKENVPDFVCLNILLGLPKDNYFREFINAKNLTSDILKTIKSQQIKKPVFVVINGIDALNLEDEKAEIFLKLIGLINNPKSFIIIISKDNHDENKSILNSPQFLNKEQYLWLKLELKKPFGYPSFIKNLTDFIIFNDSKNTSLSRGELYYTYINKALNRQTILEPEILQDELKLIAYKSFTGEQIRINNLIRHGINPEIKKFVKTYSSILYSDPNRKDVLYFSSDLIRDFLVSEYIDSLDPKDLNNNFIDENFKDKKWNTVLLFLAENLDNNFIQKFPSKLIESILNTLRKYPYFNNKDKFIKIVKMISEKDLTDEILLILSNYFYLIGDQISGLEYGIKSIKEYINSDYSENYNQISSSLLTFYLPELAIIISKKGLAFNNKDQSPRILGTKGRALIMLGRLKEAEEAFLEKKKLHEILSKEDNNKKLDVIRDKADLLYLNSFKYYKNPDENIIESSLKLISEILTDYDSYESDIQVDINSNKTHLYRHISYFLPKLAEMNNDNEIKFLDMALKIEDFPDSMTKGTIYINLGLYFSIKKQKDKAINYLEKSLPLINHSKTFLYLYYVCLYHISPLENYKIKANNYYLEKKMDSINVTNIIKNNKVRLELSESENFFLTEESFSLKNYFNLNNLNNLTLQELYMK